VNSARNLDSPIFDATMCQTGEETAYAPATTAKATWIIREFRGPKLHSVPVVRVEGRTYYLKGTFIIEFEYQADGTVIAKHRSLPILGYGQSADEALAAFAEFFDYQYRDLVECDESELTSGARQVRAALSGIVRAIN
jgi:hypothetical protein